MDFCELIHDLHDALWALADRKLPLNLCTDRFCKLRSLQEMHVVRRREHVPMLSMLQDGQVWRVWG